MSSETTPTQPATITPETTIGEIVAAQPLLARVFESLGIDYCCGGKRTLAQASAAKGLDPKTVAVLLAAGTTVDRSERLVNATTMTLSELADHIETTHHAYLRQELPALVEKADRVGAKHSWRDARLLDVAETVRELAAEMFSHMQKEELILFPLVRELEQKGASSGHCGSIANPIRQMESEHDSAGGAIARLRELTDGFTPDENSCNTHRALLAGLAHFESDLHQHVHKENNVLFPRAIALEAAAR